MIKKPISLYTEPSRLLSNSKRMERFEEPQGGREECMVGMVLAPVKIS